jgi:hypothetical protein
MTKVIGYGFRSPSEVAVDVAGDVFITDNYNDTYTVMKIQHDGAVKRIVVGFHPETMTVDGAGHIYVSDGHDVFAVLPGGKTRRIGYGFNWVSGLAVDKAGDVFVADYVDRKIIKILPNGTLRTIAAGLEAPQDVAVDSAGNVYVADTSALKKILTNGTIKIISSGFKVARGVAVDAAGNVFVSDSSTGTVREILPDGSVKMIGSGFSWPNNLACNAAGDVVVTDTNKNQVIKLSPPTITASPALMSGSTATTVSGALHGLTPYTTYFYRVVASTDSVIVADLRTPPRSFSTGTFTVTASLPNPALGQVVSLTAMIRPASATSGAPTGTITFKDGPRILGTATLKPQQGFATATLNTSVLALGGHSITAVYSGDAKNPPGISSARRLTVTKAATTTTVSTSANPAALRQPVTFTAIVNAARPGTGVPTGFVTFKDGGKTVRSVQLRTVNGRSLATLTTTGLALGTHSITVVYSGDALDAGSESMPLTETVKRFRSRTRLTTPSRALVVGRTETLMAIVARLGAGKTFPTGSVTFKDGTNPLGTATIKTVNGKSIAIFRTSDLAVGTHSITATYAGDGDEIASVSRPSLVTVLTNQGGMRRPHKLPGHLS